MSSAQQPANKVLLRLIDPGLATDDVYQKASNYEVHLAKYHPQKGKHFFCNLVARSTSWDAPVGTVEEASADGKSPDAIWKDINDVFEEVGLATAALQKAQIALLAAEQKKIALLESLRPRKCPPVSEAKAKAPTAVTGSSQKRDSGSVTSRGTSAKLSEPSVTFSVTGDLSNPPVSESLSSSTAAAAAPTAQKMQPKIHVSWIHHKPTPDPAITSAQLQDACSKFGAIDRAFIVIDSLAKKNLPYGFVEFKSADSAERAVAAKNVSIGAVLAKTCYAKGR